MSESERTAAHEAPDTDEPPSKSERKRQMHALQKLGETLVALDHARLARLTLPDPLRAAILEAKKITAHEGRRRQLQYVGKLMRQSDVDGADLARQLEDVSGESRAAVALMHRCEKLRDALLQNDSALTAFVAEHPQLDIQHLRATIRSARREHASGAAPKHARELYRWLHQNLSQPDLTPTTSLTPTPLRGGEGL